MKNTSEKIDTKIPIDKLSSLILGVSVVNNMIYGTTMIKTV
jgi:hypothetical protein